MQGQDYKSQRRELTGVGNFLNLLPALTIAHAYGVVLLDQIHTEFLRARI